MYPKTIQQDGYEVIIIDEVEEIENDNIDVHVKFQDSKHYIATFFTIANLQKLMDKNVHTGECNSGQYFWASDMVIIQDLREETILESIQYLIKEDELDYTFGYYGYYDDDSGDE